MTALTEHLKKYNLGLKERDPILGDGNFWYSTNVDLIKLYDMKAPREANELREAVTNSLLDHPQKMYWIKTQFRGKSQKFSKSIKEQSTPGTFIDRNGIMVVATADFAMNVLIDVSSMLVIIRTLLTGMMFLRKLGIIRVLKLFLTWRFPAVE